MAKLRMNLLENAYDSLNESLRLAERAEKQENAWKFAILNLVQAIELLLKERLYRENRLFIYENIDNPRNTISLQLALRRLQNVGVAIDGRDLKRIEKARQWRNLIMHYEFEIMVREVKSAYALLFEFVHSFHLKHLGGEIHDHIEPSLWYKEASLMEYFRQEVVTYQGYDMIPSWPVQIVAAQDIQAIWINGKTYPRLRYGEEPVWTEDSQHITELPCHDCGVRKGQLHVLSCDMEVCPRCSGQMITCSCTFDEAEFSEPSPPMVE